jgi:cytochrome c553
MRAMALSLSDEEIATVARFLAAQGKKAEPP